MIIQETTVKSILTRTSGFLTTVSSHSLQAYRGCPFGKSLCGTGCYVQHNIHITSGREWGAFLDVRTNAADSYRAAYHRERTWAAQSRGRFSIFMSSASEPFPPQERRYGVSRGVLEAMVDLPPDVLILQTHAHHVVEALDVIRTLSQRCELRVHISIETDRDRIADLPAHASPIDKRFQTAAALKAAGVRVVVAASPLLPIADPDRFFARIAECADGVILDHFIQGDGSALGARTQKTRLPQAMAAIDPDSVDLSYRDRMAAIAWRHLPGRVGVNIDGFAGRWLTESPVPIIIEPSAGTDLPSAKVEHS